MASLVGLCASLLILGPDLVFGRRPTLLSMRGDGAVGLAGFRYFVEDDWQFPLLMTSSLASPDGIAIAFTDSIPILALLAKLLLPLGMAPETWWGAWFCLVFVGQAAAATFALKAWRVDSALARWLGAAIACLFPAMLLRIFHPALMFQAPLLLALGMVGSLRGATSDRRVLPAVVLLPVIALLIHPYHAVAVLVTVAGGVVDAWRVERRSARFVAAWVGLTSLVLAVVLALFGYLGGVEQPGEGYGLYALIPYSFVWPQRSQIWPGRDEILLASGTFEGFVFLGAGIVMLVAVGTILGWPLRKRLVEQHIVLLVGFAAIAMYAITPRVHMRPSDPVDFGAFALRFFKTPEQVVIAVSAVVVLASCAALAILARRHEPQADHVRRPSIVAVTIVGSVALVTLVFPGVLSALSGIFRASGRLAWILAYAMLIGSIVASFRRLGTRPVIVLLVVVVAIQYFDQRPLRVFAHDLYQPDIERETQLDGMAATMAQYDLVQLTPDYVCVPFGPQLDEYIDVVVAASISGVAIDNTYAARQTSQGCDTTKSTADESTLYVSVGQPPAAFPPQRCLQWSRNVVACSHRLFRSDDP